MSGIVSTDGWRLCGLSILAAAMLAIAPGQTDASILQCQREIVKAATKLLVVQSRALERCQARVLAGRTQPPCPDTKAALAMLKAEERLRRALDRRCGGSDRECGTGDDESLDAVGWDIAACPAMAEASCAQTVTSCADVAACLGCLGRAGTDGIYALGSGPTAPETAHRSVRKCRREIGRGSARLVKTIARSLQRCEDALLRGKGGMDCPDATAAATIDKARSKLRAKACRACGGDDRACGGGDDLDLAVVGLPGTCPNVTLPGGSPCAGAIAQLDDATDCIACVTEASVTCVEAAAAPAVVAYPLACMPPTVTPTLPPPTPTLPLPTPTVTASPSVTPTASLTATASPTATASATPTTTAAPTKTASPTATPTATPTTTAAPTVTPTTSLTPTTTPTTTASPTPTTTTTPTAALTPTTTPTATASTTSTTTATPTVTPTASLTPTVTVSATPTTTTTPTPTATSTVPPTCGNGTIDPGEACELVSQGCGALQVCVACLLCVGL